MRKQGASTTQQAASTTPRLRRSDCSGPGLHRRRRGRGFSYVDAKGRAVRDQDTLTRIRELAIPPAWEDVWICTDPQGHLQATGVDAAGRKQYLYHPSWRARQDRAKFQRMLAFADALPRLRRHVTADLGGDEPTRDRVLACAVRLLDVGLFRIGSEEYAEQGAGLGLATVGKEHVTIGDGAIVFDYPAKSGVRRVHEITDAVCTELLQALKRRRGGGDELLAYKRGRRWSPLRSDDINDYVKEHVGEDFSAKDFRTWNATVLAAVAVAADDAGAATKTARQRAIKSAVSEVAELLGNTPAVARRAYIDPRVFDRYLSGWTIRTALDGLDEFDGMNDRARRRVELAVLDLLREPDDSAAVKREP